MRYFLSYISGRREPRGTGACLMWTVAILVVCCSLPALAAADKWPTCPAPPAGNPDLADLRSSLSAGAEVYNQGSPEFATKTKRWSVFRAPKPSIVVLPNTEEDVATVVRYANKNNLPFLAVTGGHGAIVTQAKMQSGIEIRMDKLNNLSIASDGKTATMQGGIRAKKVTDDLWKAGKQTVTGVCECTGLLGPALGGGHGLLQGRHGLVSDQFVSMNLVNANGELRHVDAQSDPDLWWALQGAGHNFGIVTSVTSKIYDIEHRNWAWQFWVFSGDEIEDLYSTMNDVLLEDGSQPIDVMTFSFFVNNPAVDSKRPVVVFIMLQEGKPTIDPIYTQPFAKFGPLSVQSGSSEYPLLPGLTGNGNDAGVCQDLGLSNMRFPIGVNNYNPKTQRKVYEVFASVTQQNPALNGSIFLFEGYPTQGVKAIDSDSTAFAYRHDELLFSPVMVYQGGPGELDRLAQDVGEELRDMILAGSDHDELHAYVNYAFGQESLENMYGYEHWRQQKLKSIKEKYDPNGRFSFYAPIL